MIGVCLAATQNEEYLNQWAYVLMAYPVDQVFILGDSVAHAPFKVLRYAKVIHSLDELPARPVLLSPMGGIPLESYEHPDDVIYTFGGDDGPPKYRAADFAESVAIASNDELFSFVAAAIALNSRRVARG
jgi:hypothetical protein